MKKLAAALLAVAAMAVPAMADTEVNVNVNGVDVPQKGVILESRTMVPVRGVTEQLGFTVDWDADTKTATFTRDVIVIKMTAGEKSFYVNDIPFTPDVPQAIINDRFMLPLRAMCESVGAEVDWDADTKTASISTKSLSMPDLSNISLPTEKKEDDGDNTGASTDIGTKIETGIPGISIEIIDPSEAPDNITDIEI